MGLNFVHVAWGRYTRSTLFDREHFLRVNQTRARRSDCGGDGFGGNDFCAGGNNGNTSAEIGRAGFACSEASPNPFTYHGYIRAYDFTRQNAYSSYGVPSGVGGKANQSSENNAISLSGNYAFSGSGFSVGASYLYANPFNQCSNPATASSAAPGPCGTASHSAGSQSGHHVAAIRNEHALRSVPQVQWQLTGTGSASKAVTWRTVRRGRRSRIRASSRSRIKAPILTIRSTRTGRRSDGFWQWECRTCSNFDQGTLLTAVAPGGYTYSGATAYSNLYLAPNCTPGVPAHRK